MSDSFATRWTVAHKAPLSMEFFRQEYWSVLPLSSAGDLPDSGIQPVCPGLAGVLCSLAQNHLGSPTID